ncbi:glycerophosphodiester phosphodiesterase [Flavivirga algicola]|uniref:Glycerophosphodiester phosphodiesterase n=1 Tax=Flavivirga algicola TaxID=2729136 RepID=A0ABX1RXX3_9FLAO|nr:glycerophosphodiester phosphodiesterase family protein [Flavivirga algicola]NMH87262.1 glycerophosphodiester phosphodiesterase [Flavivirga algicola]
MNKTCLRIGHRGAKGYVAENTIESIQHALSLDVDGIEIDIHQCASGELVVFHDFTLDRVTNGSGEISEHILSELKHLKVKEQYSIPTLEDVLNLIDKKCLLNIELKGKNTVEETSRLIDFYVDKKGWKYQDFIVSSFQQDLLASVYKINKKIPLGVLTDTDLDQAIAFGKTIHAVAIHPDYTMLTKTHISTIKSLGFKVFTYTVNDKKTISRMKKHKVDGVISDFPDRI